MCMCLLGHVSACGLVCWWIVHASMYKERPQGDVDVGCPPPSLYTQLTEAGSLTDPGPH